MAPKFHDAGHEKRKEYRQEEVPVKGRVGPDGKQLLAELSGWHRNVQLEIVLRLCPFQAHIAVEFRHLINAVSQVIFMLKIRVMCQFLPHIFGALPEGDKQRCLQKGI